MSITLDHDYSEGLEAAAPTFFGSEDIKPPHGALGATHIIPAQIIPPLNTNIDFSMLPNFELSAHRGLSALSEEPLPTTFNWRYGTLDDEKGKFDGEPSKIISNLAKPGNQMLCGSCWAIAAAGIVSDNFVISKVTPYNPNLSTTYSLACYPQNQCRGGNPALLLQSIAKGGLVSKNCIDYSWCSQNQLCNGTALKHFKKSDKVDLNSLIPNCGCYEAGDFLEYRIDAVPGPQRISLGASYKDKKSLNPAEFTRIVKTHIRHNGYLLGSFIVFKNFMKGLFTKGKENKGIYFEDASYTRKNGTVNVTYHDKNEEKELVNKDYVGSHAIAIIGWGVEKDTQIDSKGTRKDVPYWYCRNSWTTNWGDGGYFKMAMYPFNRISQFDKTIIISSPRGRVQGGGMIIFRTTQQPRITPFHQVQEKFLKGKRDHPAPFYEKDIKHVVTPKNGGGKSGGKFKFPFLTIGEISGVIFLVSMVFILGYFSGRKNKKWIRNILTSVIVVLQIIVSVLTVRYILKRYCKYNCKKAKIEP